MVKVRIWGGLRVHTGGEAEVEVDAQDLRGVVAALGARYPEMKPALEGGVSMSIDGRLYTNRWFEKVRPDSEVVVLPRIVGG